MKTFIRLMLLPCLILSLWGCAGGEDMQAYAVRRCRKIVSLCQDIYAQAEKTESQEGWDYPTVSQDSLDALEALLLEEGFDVLDSGSEHPSYLATASRFYEFWEQVQQGKSARQELIALSGYGILEYRLLVYSAREKTAYLHSMTWSLDRAAESNYEVCRVLDWEVTEKGNFYYQTRAVDHSHYEDYTLVRLRAPDETLYGWNMQCVMPVGYIATNLFLTDWSESDWGALSFNDLWEYLYLMEYGEPYLPQIQGKRCQIPAEAFEQMLMPYFRVELDTFRRLAQYSPETDSYPWRRVEPNDFDFLGFYACTPEVTACRDNGDGTLTLTVEVLSTDLKTDCLFSHEVTVRPLEKGAFQYVSNKITYQTSFGLPDSRPRLTWD